MIRTSLICNPASDDSRIHALTDRLLTFYASNRTYTAFQSPAVHEKQWAVILPIIDALLTHRDRISVLELGAGCSAFGTTLADRRERVDYTVQDVTHANVDYLATIADRVLALPIEQLAGSYDLVFSTYVLEHVTTPRDFLTHVNRLLRPGGWHVLFCPRYDVPIYPCPSLRRRTLLSLIASQMQLIAGQTLSLLDRTPRFFINVDPAIDHGAWYRDADAIHIVTRRAVELWHKQNGFRSERLKLSATSGKQRLQFTLMLLANAFQKV